MSLEGLGLMPTWHQTCLKQRLGAVREEFNKTSPADIVAPVKGHSVLGCVSWTLTIPLLGMTRRNLRALTQRTSDGPNPEDVPDVCSSQLAELYEQAPANNKTTGDVVSSLSEQPLLRYGHIVDDDPFVDYHHVDVGEDDAREVNTAIEGMMPSMTVFTSRASTITMMVMVLAAVETRLLSEAGQARLTKMV